MGMVVVVVVVVVVTTGGMSLRRLHRPEGGVLDRPSVSESGIAQQREEQPARPRHGDGRGASVLLQWPLCCTGVEKVS